MCWHDSTIKEFNSWLDQGVWNSCPQTFTKTLIIFHPRQPRTTKKATSSVLPRPSLLDGFLLSILSGREFMNTIKDERIMFSGWLLLPTSLISSPLSSTSLIFLESSPSLSLLVSISSPPPTLSSTSPRLLRSSESWEFFEYSNYPDTSLVWKLLEQLSETATGQIGK